MKKQITIIILIFVTIFANAQTIIAPDTISVNTVWADTIFLNTNVYIENGVQLEIKPGATVIANGWYGIDCQGQLLAEGTQLDSIKFTVADTTGFYNIYDTIGGWRGINFDSTLSTNDSSIIDHCIIEYGKACDTINYKKYNGGAINVKFYSKLKILNSKFYNNYSVLKGGAMYIRASSFLIKNNDILYNWSITEGGGIYIIGISNIELIQNNFISNKSGTKDNIAPTGLPPEIIYQKAGAALYIKNIDTSIYCRSLVISNTFVNNNSESGTFCEASMHTIFANNTLFNNKGQIIAASGGPFSNSTYINNTIINNKITYEGVQIMEQLAFYNNILIADLNNINNPDSLLLILTGYVPPYPEYGTHLNVKYNYISVSTPTDGEGNIYGTTPQFINPSPNTDFVSNWQDYDWRLQPTSPCINAGIIDTTGLDLPEQDAFGNPRIFGSRVDIGAYENQTEVWNNIFSLDEKMQITYYPNPVIDNLNIKIESKELINKNLGIYDINGKLLKTIEITSSQTPRNDLITINISDLKTGVYYLRIAGLSKEFIKL